MHLYMRDSAESALYTTAAMGYKAKETISAALFFLFILQLSLHSLDISFIFPSLSPLPFFLCFLPGWIPIT